MSSPSSFSANLKSGLRSLGAADAADCARLSAAERRQRFLVDDLFQPGLATLVHWDVDRTLVGGVVPTEAAIALSAPPEFRAATLLERRELGIINLGGPGTVEVGGERHVLGPRDGLYLGRGSADPVFHSVSATRPATFYLLGYPAHRACPSAVVRRSEITGNPLGQPQGANQRSIFKYFAPGLVETCQLTMGITELQTGSIWNTMPPHTHARRSEVYCYFDLPPGEIVVHLMGAPADTAHLCVGNLQTVLSPPWSIHAGAGTCAYSFVWGMGGENQEFADMDRVALTDLR